MQTIPLTRELVLIGGGHAHALVLRSWGMRPLPGARVTVINPGPTAPYTGMLPGFVAGHYGRDDLDIDLVRLARFAGARLILGAASVIDPEARTVTVGERVLPFDVASVDIGITSEMPEIPGFADHAIPAKPLGRLAGAWARFLASDGPADIAVIGGGVAGVELAMAMVHAARAAGRAPTCHVIEAERALNGLGVPARDRLLTALKGHGITLIEGAEVAQITPKAVELADGREIPSTFTTGAAGARPYPWLAQTGLEHEGGFLSVGPTLETSARGIFAAGDCAHLRHAPRPKAGVFAVREAPILFHNLKARLSGGALRQYRPQKSYLKLISLGGKAALAEKAGFAVQGEALWRWKDQIDRAFMRKFQDLEPMTVAVPRRAAMGAAKADPLCGGCGAKVGKGALDVVLAGLPAIGRADIERLPGDDAAVLRMGKARQVVTTDHLRAVTDDPYTMARIAAVHALGDVWAMGAAPQAALATVILPRMAEPMQRVTLAEVMAAAQEVFSAEGAEIAGGHSSMGSELTIGFTVTGLLEREAITLAGAKPGDAIVLTKAIGTGTVLAAEMRLRARGADVVAALDHMMQSQGPAARLLSAAHAMTDVTGFGLAGHLWGICQASGVSAEITIDDVPLLSGAEALAAEGIASTLAPANRVVAKNITFDESAKTALLFDPQTAGGLLAAVSPDAAEGIVAQLREAGYDAAVIGRFGEGPPHITVV
ncbi:selenide, water dikinase SelD [Aestuariibius sp. 2305UL40-4]|uniref:selenide, water dikinase SelD n=1 Tax=Aestuariibius violaceus TaxID=3234132 RepID=UPI00345E2866